MTKSNRHIFPNWSPCPHRHGLRLILFQNRPNLLNRDNYPSTKLQKNLEHQANIWKEYFRNGLSLEHIV